MGETMATFRQRGGRWQAIIRRVDLKATKTFDRLTDAKGWARAKERDADLGHLPGKLTGTLRPVNGGEAATPAAYRLNLAGRSATRDGRVTADDLAKITAHADQQTRSMIDGAAIVRVLAVEPLRLSELLGIQWPDVNRARRSVI